VTSVMSGKDSAGGKGPVDTSSMYVELSKLQQRSEFEKAVKQCNKILNVDPQDVTAFHCKMVNLLHLDKFKDALHQIQTSHLAENVDLSFEEAYCLYQENRCAEALKVLDKKGQGQDRPLKVKELRAQILYRLERYKECMAVYRDIIKNSDMDGSDDFEVERMTNLAAVVVHLNAAQGGGAGGEKLPETEDETYEMVYNKACCLLATGEFAEAERLLKEAEKMCVEFLKEDLEAAGADAGDELNQEEIDQETGIIRAQRAYAIQRQSGSGGSGDANANKRIREAQSIYNSVLKAKPSDIGLVAVASNNLIVINKDQNIFDSKKKIKAASVEGLEHKLTSMHQAAIAKNNALLTMYTNQVSQCQELVASLLSGSVVSKEEADMIVAGAMSRSGRTQEALDLILKAPSGSGKVEKVLMAAQILLEKGEMEAALDLMDKQLPEAAKCRAGVLSAMVTLCVALEDRARAAKLLKAAAKASSRSAASDMSVVWRKTAEFHLKGDEPSVAAQSLEELLKMEPNNIQTQAQLVLAYAKYDLAKALGASKKLPKFAASDVIDIEALEDSSFVSTKYTKSRKDGGPTSPKPATPAAASVEAAAKKKKQRKRKKRLPKNLNVEPDPERWLPRRERTGYRKPRKNRRNKDEKFTGAQGLAAGAAETFDYSQKKASTAAASPQPGKASVAEPPQGPRQQQWKPQAKKKKSKKRM